MDKCWIECIVDLGDYAWKIFVQNFFNIGLTDVAVCVCALLYDLCSIFLLYRLDQKSVWFILSLT